MQSLYCRFIKCFYIVCALVTSFTACAAEEIAITKITTDGIEVLNVNKAITELHFYKDKTVSIKGLEQLPQLRKVTFMMTAFIKDYSFLSDNANIEILAFDNCKVDDFKFILKLPKLKILVINSCRLKHFSFDFFNNQKLEMLQLNNIRIGDSVDRVTAVPELYNVPRYLKYLDLSFNDITLISPEFIEATKDVMTIFMSGNRIEESSVNVDRYGNIELFFNEDKLPKEFHSSKIW